MCNLVEHEEGEQEGGERVERHGGGKRERVAELARRVRAIEQLREPRASGARREPDARRPCPRPPPKLHMRVKQEEKNHPAAI